jgi:hypothetical protein
MPPEQSPLSNQRPTRAESGEQGQRPPITAGVRGLLGLPVRESELTPTTPLTAPLRSPHYGQLPLPASEENDQNFCEIALEEELIEARGSTSTDPQNHFPAALPDAAFSRATPGKPADARSAPSAMSVENREHTSFVIPGVSTHRTEFTALSHTSGTTKSSQVEQSEELGTDKMAPEHAPASLLHPHDSGTFDHQFFSRLEHLVTEGAKARNDSETQRRPVMAFEQMGVTNGEQGDTELARRLAQLQRVVDELAATLSRNRDERQAQPRERKTPPLQRMVIIKQSDASPTTPRAFWERSRLGRFYLKTGR